MDYAQADTSSSTYIDANVLRWAVPEPVIIGEYGSSKPNGGVLGVTQVFPELAGASLGIIPAST